MEKPLQLQLQKLEIGKVTSCDINANYLLAVGLSDKNIRILEWKVGLGFVDMCYSPLNFHKYGVTSVRFSPKGTMLASASLDGTAVLTDVLTGSKIFTMVQYNTSNIVFCEFTFDCTKLITGADDGMLCFWDLIHHNQIRECRLHEDDYSLRGVAISPDSEYLLSIDSGNLLKLWFVGDVIHNQPLCILLRKNAHDDVLYCDFSPVKKTIGESFLNLSYCAATCGTNGLVKIWNVVIQRRLNYNTNLKSFNCDLRLLHVLKHDTDILCVRFNLEGNFIVSTGLDNLVKLWEVRTGKCLKTLQGHTKYVTSATFSKDSLLLATGSIDKSFIIWDLTGSLTLDSELLIPCNISYHFTNINVISYNAGVNESDQENTYNEFTVLQNLNFSSVVNSVQFQGNDVLAIAGGNKSLEIWKKKTDKYEKAETLKEHESSINHLNFFPCGGKIISGSADGTMIFWDLNINLTYKMRSPNCNGSIKTCKFSPDSKVIVAAGDDHTVYLWDANNLEFIKNIQTLENSVTAVAFTPDGEFLVSTSGTDITLQNLTENKPAVYYNNAHDLGVLCCDFSLSKISEVGETYNTWVITSSHINTCLPCFSSITPALSMVSLADHAQSWCDGRETWQASVNVTWCYNPESDTEMGRNFKYFLATGGIDSLVKLWTLSAEQIFSSTVLSGHGGSVNYVKFSTAEPFLLASCSSDNTVRIWDTKKKLCLHVLNYHQSAVTTCSFSEDSTFLATGSLDKTVLIFNLTERLFHKPRESDQNSNKVLENWTSSDLVTWFIGIGRPEIAKIIQAKQISGRHILTNTDDSIADLFGLATEKDQKQLQFLMSCLKKSSAFPSDFLKRDKSIPHKFLCPITHQIMKDPVICSDGYTYDRSAITEWFLSGKLISPVTKECLTTAKLLPYSALKMNIYKFLFQNE